MPWPKHNKLVIKGVYGTSLETWSYSLKFKQVFGTDFDVTVDEWDKAGVSSAVVTWHSAGWANPAAKLTGWHGYSMDAENHADLNKLVQHTYSPAISPPQGGVVHPFQCSVVIGLESLDRSPRAPGKKDPARFGRVYLPGPGFAIEQDGRFPSSQALQLAENFRTLVESLKNAMYPSLVTDEEMVLVSPFPIGSPAGTEKRVDRYRVGRVVDTMQSRRRQLVEDYQVVER